MTAIYNMIFLLQTRIAKSMRGEVMDEELFRTYFIRLFRGIRQMENKFKAFFDPEEQDSFIKYSKSMCDLAQIFKLTKQDKSLDEKAKVELLKKKNFKKNQSDLSRMIFGVGQVPKEMKNKTCIFRIMPSNLLGFSKVQQRLIRDLGGKHGRQDLAELNSDINHEVPQRKFST